MKKILLIVPMLGFIACASKTNKIVEHTGHMHGQDCGHKMVKHGNHFDYIHGEEFHHQSQSKSISLHGMIEKKKARSLAHTDDSSSTHLHGQKCGHEFVTHGEGELSHVDYIVPDGNDTFYEDEHGHFHGLVTE